MAEPDRAAAPWSFLIIKSANSYTLPRIAFNLPPAAAGPNRAMVNLPDNKKVHVNDVDPGQHFNQKSQKYVDRSKAF